MKEPTISLEQVAKTYHIGTVTVEALRDITIAFHRDEFWSVMGPSGSGKSTMLNLLGCLDRPSGGRLSIGGVDVTHMNDDALSDIRLTRIGFIFQSFNLVPQLSVRENIELPLYYQGMDLAARRERAEALADRVGLADRLRHRPTELSGGQRQRVAVARALANDPDVILADEPTGNLDTKTGKQIMDLLAELNHEGCMIIMVTHEADIAAFSRRKLLLRDGCIEGVE